MLSPLSDSTSVKYQPSCFLPNKNDRFLLLLELSWLCIDRSRASLDGPRLGPVGTDSVSLCSYDSYLRSASVQRTKQSMGRGIIIGVSFLEVANSKIPPSKKVVCASGTWRFES